MAPTAPLSCKRKVLQSALKTTGELIYFHSMEDVKTVKADNHDTCVCPSETLILPIITFVVMVVYAAVAIFFYNSDV